MIPNKRFSEKEKIVDNAFLFGDGNSRHFHQYETNYTTFIMRRWCQLAYSLIIELKAINHEYKQYI